MSESASVSTFALAGICKLAHLCLEEAGRHAELGLAVGISAAGIVAGAIPEYLTAHTCASQVWFVLEIGRVMSKGTLVSLLTSALFEEHAHLSLGELRLLSFRAIGPL